MLAQDTGNKCGRCCEPLVFINTDPFNGLKGYWKCINPKCKEDSEVSTNGVQS